MGILTLPLTSYRLPSPQAATPRLINCYPEAQYKASSKGPFLLRRAPGIASWVTAGSGPIRGAIIHAGTLIVVSGTSVYSIASDGTVSSAFTGSVPGGERVRMSTNGTNFVIVRPSTNLAYYNSAATTISQITDATFVGWGAADVDYLDGYFVFRRPDSQQFFNSGLNALTFNALDIATAEGAPDNLKGLIVDHRELFLPGTSSSEIWYNAALSPGSPFAQSPNGLIELGLGASYSLGKQDNSIIYLANDKTFRRLQGITPQRVSQHGIEGVVQRLSMTDDCFALPYSQEGHLFVAFTFPFAGRTLVYDATTTEWHERESLGYDRWRANVIIDAYNMTLVGDSESGKVGILDPDTHEDFGEAQRVEFTFASVYSEGNRASHRRFELGVNTGYGLLTGQGQNPLATLKISDDGGETFRAMPTKSLGLRGHYQARCSWWRLGSSRDRVYRVEVSDPVDVFVLNATLEGSGMRL